MQGAIVARARHGRRGAVRARPLHLDVPADVRRRPAAGLRRHVAGPAEAAPAGNAFAQTFLKSFVEHWKDTREYTLAVLDAMPADKFTSA